MAASFFRVGADTIFRERCKPLPGLQYPTALNSPRSRRAVRVERPIVLAR